MRHVQESATQRLLLERNDIDVARNLNPEDVAGAREADGVEISDELKGRLMYISLNQKHPQLSKPEVRQAIKYLVDYEGMQNSFLNGQYTIHQNFLPPDLSGCVETKPVQPGHRQGQGTACRRVEPFEIEVGVREAQERIEIGQSLQNAFAEAGITVNITVGTAKAILGRYRARELDMYMGAWGPDYPDPQTNAGTFAFNPDNSDEAGATGLLAWRNAGTLAGLTEKVAAAVIENDRDSRAQMYQDIQAEFREISPSW